MKKNIQDRTFDFAVIILDAYFLLREKGHYKLSEQLVKSGTSIGANVEEAQAAHSKADFINKLTIANKEARETRYWIRLFNRKELLLDFPSYEHISKEIEEIILILNSIIKKSRSNLS